MISLTKRFFPAAIVLVLIFAPCSAADPQSNDDKSKTDKPVESPYFKAIRPKASQDKTRVYTNEDLSRHASDSDNSDTQAEAAAPSSKDKGTASSQPASLDPLAQMQENKRLGAERETRIEAARAKLDSARQVLADLQKRIAAIRNPYLARPAAPQEGAEEWNKMSARERVERSEREMDAARQAVTQAENELAALERSR